MNRMKDKKKTTRILLEKVFIMDFTPFPLPL
jgi:hypothetical protein